MKAVLSMQGVAHAYGDSPSLQGVDLSIAPGEFVALVGPNGTGKTTLLRIACGVLEPSQGLVTVGGHCMREHPFAAKSALGFGIASEELPRVLTGRQVLELVASTRGLPAIPDESLDLAADLGATPDLDVILGRCSLGQKQKVGVLAATIGEPSLLLLDEPVNGLDPLAAYELKRYLREKTRGGAMAVLMATHALGGVVERYVDRVLLMLRGAIVQEWSAAEMSRIRADKSLTLEDEMIAVLAGDKQASGLSPGESAAKLPPAGA